MPIALPPLPNLAIFFSLTSYAIDLERAHNLQTLDLHHKRLESYLMALRDASALPGEDLRKLNELFTTLYRQQFSHLGGAGHALMLTLRWSVVAK